MAGTKPKAVDGELERVSAGAAKASANDLHDCPQFLKTLGERKGATQIRMAPADEACLAKKPIFAGKV
jgi:hypothetical protein